MGGIRGRLLPYAVAAAALVLAGVVAVGRYYAAGMHPIYFASGLEAKRALARYLTGDYAGAARELRAHLAHHPEEESEEDGSYRALLAGRLDAAEAAARKTLEAEPADVPAAMTLAQTLLARQSPVPALEILRPVIDAAPNRPIDVLALAAIAESRAGQYEAAIRSWQRTMRYGEPGSRLTVYAAALETAQLLLDGPPKRGRDALLAQVFRYLQFFDHGARRLVRRHARAAINAGDHIADSWVALGDMERRSHRAEAALYAFQQALASDDGNSAAHYQLARMYSDRGDLAGELRHALLAYERAADAEAAQWLLRLLGDKFGDYERVTVVAKQRLAEGRREYAVLLELGQAYGALGNYAAAIDAYQMILELWPRDSWALAHLAFWQAKAGHRAEAIDLAKRAASLKRDWAYPLRLVAREMAEDFRYEEAIPVYEAAFRLERPRDEDLASLCTLYHGTSRWKLGVQCFETVLHHNPSNARAQRMLAEARNNAALAERQETAAPR